MRVHYARIADFRHTVDHHKLFERGVGEVLDMVGIGNNRVRVIDGDIVPARRNIITVGFVGRITLFGGNLIRHGGAVSKHVHIVHGGNAGVCRALFILLQLAMDHTVGVPFLIGREDSFVIQLALVQACGKRSDKHQFSLSARGNLIATPRREGEHIFIVLAFFCRKRLGGQILGAAVDSERFDRRELMIFIDCVGQRIAVNRHSAIVVERDLPLHAALAVDIRRVVVQRMPVVVILRLISNRFFQDAGNSHIAGMNRDGRFRNLSIAVVGNHRATAVVLDGVVRRSLRRDRDLRQCGIAVQVRLEGIRNSLAVGQGNAFFYLTLNIERQDMLLRKINACAIVQRKEHGIACWLSSCDFDIGKPDITGRNHIVRIGVMTDCHYCSVITIGMRARVVITIRDVDKLQLLRQNIRQRIDMQRACAGVCHDHHVEYIIYIIRLKQILAADWNDIISITLFSKPDDALLSVEFFIYNLGMIDFDRGHTGDGIFVFLLASP